MADAEPTYTGARYVPGFGGPVLALEHEHRYELAARCADGLRVLDLGCGDGYGSQKLATRAREVVGVDIDSATIAHATSRYSAENLQFQVADAMSLPFGDATFNLCVAFECIEHVDDPHVMLDEVMRVLAPDGLFMVSTPNREVAWDADPAVNPFHKRVYSLDALLALLEAQLEVRVVLGQVVSAASFAWTLSDSGRPLQQFARNGRAGAAKYFIVVAAVDQGPAAQGDLDSIYVDAEQRVLTERDEFWTAGQEANERLAEANERLAEAGAELERRAGEAERLQRMVRALERRQFEAENELARLPDMAAELEEAGWRLEEARRRLADLAAELEEARRRLEKSDRLLNLALNSRSWRITRPLRRSRPTIESLREAD